MAKTINRKVFKYQTCYTSNITGKKICMPQRNRREALADVKKLRADNNAHKRVGDIILWKNIRVKKR